MLASKQGDIKGYTNGTSPVTCLTWTLTKRDQLTKYHAMKTSCNELNTML